MKFGLTSLVSVQSEPKLVWNTSDHSRSAEAAERQAGLRTDGWTSFIDTEDSGLVASNDSAASLLIWIGFSIKVIGHIWGCGYSQWIV